MQTMRRFTAGIQLFDNIRERELIYVDKTDLVYQLAHESQFVFLSRPRRKGARNFSQAWQWKSWKRSGRNIQYFISI